MMTGFYALEGISVRPEGISGYGISYPGLAGTAGEDEAHGFGSGGGIVEGTAYR